MSKRLRQDELDELRDRSRRDGTDAADSAPLSRSAPPDDARPLAGLPLPRGLFPEDLTALEIASVSEAWLEGYRECMAGREAGGEVRPPEPLLWWSPAVPGGWPAGWRYHHHDPGGDANDPASRRDGAVAGSEALDSDADDSVVRRRAADGGAPDRVDVDWSTARVVRKRER